MKILPAEVEKCTAALQQALKPDDARFAPGFGAARPGTSGKTICWRPLLARDEAGQPKRENTIIHEG